MQFEQSTGWILRYRKAERHTKDIPGWEIGQKGKRHEHERAKSALKCTREWWNHVAYIMVGFRLHRVLKAEQEFGLQAGTTRDNLTFLCRGVLWGIRVRELIWQRSGLYSTSLLTVLDVQIQSHNLTSSDRTSCQSHQLSLTSVTHSHLWKRPQFKLLLCSLILLFPIWWSCFYWWQQVFLIKMLRRQF